MTERIYYRDGDLLDFSARVVAVDTVAGHPAVMLDRTAFYPTSGGQPFDTGQLADVAVIEVIDRDGEILHLLAGPAPAIGVGVIGRIDPVRRRDHTQQHTGQHVLSQAFERAGPLRTVSFHLGADVCTIDLETPTLPPSIVQAAETLANQIVLEDRSVIVHFAPVDELERFGLRKPTQRTGEIRIVEVEDFDRSACGGTHVKRTGQIGPIKVRRWERRGATSRVEFLCGWRALADYRARLETTRLLAERLSVRDLDLSEALGRALDDLDRLRDETARLRDTVLDREAGDLCATSSTLPRSPHARLVVGSFENRPPDELRRLATSVLKRGPAVVLLGSSGARAHLVFAQQPGLPDDMGSLLRQVIPLIGGRGGGSRDLAQGGSATGAGVFEVLHEAQRLLQSG
ncbi:MAG: alanyl-tRNA editing protein [Chloroflexota bacterium]